MIAKTNNQGFKDRPSFRDMMAFVFQPQHIVANPNVLFYKADITEHREKLRTIFPYVLGAVTPNVLGLQYEVQRLRTELRRKEREAEGLARVSDRWVSELRARSSRAYELGLIREAPAREASFHELIDALRAAVQSQTEDAEVTTRAVEDSARELVALQGEESRLSATISTLKHRFSEMTRFR